ncbi:MAG: phosphotransferase [Micromonosporaceae bacterium]
MTCDDSLRRVAELLRELHNLTAGVALADGHEVVCHNDLSPKNTVYRDLGAGLRPVGFIDWDICLPGTGTWSTSPAHRRPCGAWRRHRAYRSCGWTRGSR